MAWAAYNIAQLPCSKHVSSALHDIGSIVDCAQDGSSGSAPIYPAVLWSVHGAAQVYELGGLGAWVLSSQTEQSARALFQNVVMAWHGMACQSDEPVLSEVLTHRMKYVTLEDGDSGLKHAKNKDCALASGSNTQS